jgi:hypothetical protein
VSEIHRAEQLYRELVAAGRDHALWDELLNRQINLGSDDFVARMQALAEPASTSHPDIPKPQRSAPRSLAASYRSQARQTSERPGRHDFDR